MELLHKVDGLSVDFNEIRLEKLKLLIDKNIDYKKLIFKTIDMDKLEKLIFECCIEEEMITHTFLRVHDDLAKYIETIGNSIELIDKKNTYYHTIMRLKQKYYHMMVYYKRFFSSLIRQETSM